MSYQLHSEVGGDSACKGKDACDEVRIVVTVIMMMVAMMMIKVMMMMMIKIIMMNKLPMSDVVDDTIQKIIALKRIHRKS
jgi:uncharacterized membrane protein (Fun14 family)